jgi:dual-specificity kinase
MSTPSTATATFPHHHQYFTHHQNYPATVSEYRQTVNYPPSQPYHINGNAHANSSTSDLRRTATANSRQTNQLPPLRNSHSSSEMSSTRRSQRKPDWSEFYKNGVPKEVIVIDDDSPEPAGAANGTVSANGYTKPADKKLRTAYDLVYHQQPTYSATQTPYYDHSVSTDRTTSAYTTTAATSLTSQASNGTYPPAYEDAAVGQKRKRTRGAAAEEAKAAKRREIEQRRSPVYFPPPKPPIKAKDVYVEVIPDVSDSGT